MITEPRSATFQMVNLRMGRGHEPRDRTSLVMNGLGRAMLEKHLFSKINEDLIAAIQDDLDDCWPVEGTRIAVTTEGEKISFTLLPNY